MALIFGVAFVAAGAEESAPASVKSMPECVAEARRIVTQMTLPEKIAQTHGTLGKHSKEIGNREIQGLPHVHIPTYNFTNGPVGAGNGGIGHQGPATALPAPIALAATFDVKEAYAYGRICGRDALD